MSDHALVPESDSPITEPDADRLGRGEIAARLYRLLTTAPAEWPVRVALLGAWGEGKTSVANLVAASAAKDRHVVVTYPVSSIASVEDLWLGFGQALCRAIDTGQLLQPHELPFRRLELATGLRRRPWLGPGAANAAGAAVALKFPTWAATARSTVAGLFSWLARNAGIGPTAVTKIRSKLAPDRRVIVVLDDLDRADPQVVPELLLRLRDLLELPQFSFLVPFDRGVVARTLSAHHPAWKNPDRFLEKIFDYQIDLPEPSLSTRLRMIEGEIERHCPFVPLHLVDRLRDVLPPSPRKLKSLVRHLYLYRDEAARHDEGEIDWWTVLCFELLRQVSPRHRQLAIDALERWPEHERNDRRARSVQEAALKLATHDDLQAFIFQIFNEAEPTIGTSQDARDIVVTWLNWPQKSLERTALGDIRLLETSSLISAGECREQFEKWQEERRLEPLLKWIDEQTVVKAANAAETVAAFASRALERRSGLLVAMYHADLAEEHRVLAEEAGDVLDLIETLLTAVNLGGGSSEELYGAILGQTAEYAHLVGSTADCLLRCREAEMLERLIDTAGDRIGELLRQLDGTHSDATNRKPWRELRERLIDRAKPSLAAHLRKQFQSRNGLSDLVPLDAPLVIKTLILGGETPLWVDDAPVSFWTLLEQDNVSAQISKNALNLLHTCIAFLDRLETDQQLARAFLAHETRVAALWRAATLHERQFNRLHGCRELRDRLITANDALEPMLPLPSWLSAIEADVGS